MIKNGVPWRTVILRDQRVLARCDEAGNLVAEDGRVEIRYRPDDGRAYRAAARNLGAVEGEPILPNETCADATVVGSRQPKKRVSRSKSSKGRLRTGDKTESAVVAYTDGACSGNPGPAGVGVVLDRGSERRELSMYLGRATNNIAELTAIKCAAEVMGDNSGSVRIYTDSRYAIGVLSEGWKAKANQDLIAEVRDALAPLTDLQLVYVPGHSGHPLNERADELARLAIRAESSQGWKKVER